MQIFKLQIILLVVLFAIWNIFTPVLEGADEPGHFCHADYIAHRNKLPDLKVKDGCFLWHPPLYYLTLVPFIKISRLEEFNDNYFRINPKINLLRKGEYAQFVHTQRELLLKWDKKTILIHSERLVSSFFGFFIILLTWKLSKKIFNNKLLQNASLLLFFNPMFLHIFTTITNVTLLSFITTIIIYLDLSRLKIKRSVRFYGLLGILFGFGFLTKNSIINLIPPILVSFWINSGKFNNKIKYRLLCGLTFLVTFLMTAGLYVLRSLYIYGSVIEFNVLKSLPGEHYHETLLQNIGLINYINSFFLTIFKTFWSGYGALTVNFPNFVNVILLIFVEFIILVFCLKVKKINIYIRLCIIYISSALALLFLENFLFAAMHAKDLFIVYLPLAIIFGFGLCNLSNLKNLFKSRLLNIMVIILPVYLYSQSEIVNIFKHVIGMNMADNRQFFHNLLLLFSKVIICLGVVYIIQKLVKRFQPSHRWMVLTSIALFSFDIITLGFTVYLFYFKFIQL